MNTFKAPIADIAPEIAAILEAELDHQRDTLEAMKHRRPGVPVVHNEESARSAKWLD